MFRLTSSAYLPPQNKEGATRYIVNQTEVQSSVSTHIIRLWLPTIISTRIIILYGWVPGDRPVSHLFPSFCPLFCPHFSFLVPLATSKKEQPSTTGPAGFLTTELFTFVPLFYAPFFLFSLLTTCTQQEGTTIICGSATG